MASSPLAGRVAVAEADGEAEGEAEPVTVALADGDAEVVVLHDLSLAAAYADRVLLLADGAPVADGPVAEVLRAPLLSEVHRHPVEVLAHPRTGSPLVLPVRG